MCVCVCVFFFCFFFFFFFFFAVVVEALLRPSQQFIGIFRGFRPVSNQSLTTVFELKIQNLETFFAKVLIRLLKC